MSQSPITTKSELLAAIGHSWRALNDTLDRLTQEQFTTPRDTHGWSVTDHLVHMAAWEQSVVFLLQGKPRHSGLGVTEALYLTGDEDAINAAIQQQRRDLAPAEALRALRTVHQQLLEQLHPLTDADLHQPYRHYLPDEPGEGDGPPVINLIYGNTAHHFAEHLDWIETLVDGTVHPA